MFLCLIILVCKFSYSPTVKNYICISSHSTCLFRLHFRTEHLTYLPAQPFLAEAVPGDEGDYPYISRGSVIRNQSFRAYVRCEHGGGDI